MIKADAIDVTEQRFDPVNPPAKTRLPMRVPVVDRAAPKLPVGAEGIRRHAATEARAARFVELEQLRVGPDIAGIGRHEKGKIADEFHARGLRVCLELRALEEQEELREADLIDPAKQLAARAGQRITLATNQFRGPVQ